MPLHYGPAYRETQTCSLTFRCFQTLEWLEDTFQVSGVDSRPIIANGKEPLPGLLLRCNVNTRWALAAMLQCVVEQNLEDLYKAVRFAGDLGQFTARHFGSKVL